MTLVALVAIGFGAISPVGASEAESDWYGVDSSGEATVALYLVHSSTCPHCAEAEPFLDEQRGAVLVASRDEVIGGKVMKLLAQSCQAGLPAADRKLWRANPLASD